MVAKKSPPKNDVARRLSGIKHLFLAAETKKTESAFGSTDDGSDVPAVAGVDVLEDIATFTSVTSGVEAALTQAVTAFGGYSQAQLDGDARGAAAEVHADVRALTNVALGLSPPSRAFYDKVLGGLVEDVHAGKVATDPGAVRYAPLRVSVEGIEKQGHGLRLRNGVVHQGSHGSPLSPHVMQTVIRLQTKVVATYLEKIPDGPQKVHSALKPIVNAAKSELAQLGAHGQSLDEAFKSLTAQYSGDVDEDMKDIEARFGRIYHALS